MLIENISKCHYNISKKKKYIFIFLSQYCVHILCVNWALETTIFIAFNIFPQASCQLNLQHRVKRTLFGKNQDQEKHKGKIFVLTFLFWFDQHLSTQITLCDPFFYRNLYFSVYWDHYYLPPSNLKYVKSSECTYRFPSLFAGVTFLINFKPRIPKLVVYA